MRTGKTTNIRRVGVTRPQRAGCGSGAGSGCGEGDVDGDVDSDDDDSSGDGDGGDGGCGDADDAGDGLDDQRFRIIRPGEKLGGALVLRPPLSPFFLISVRMVGNICLLPVFAAGKASIASSIFSWRSAWSC